MEANRRGLCAYCMRSIRTDTHSRIEHLIPSSEDKEKATNYSNMLGVCDGEEKITGQQGRRIFAVMFIKG